MSMQIHDYAVEKSGVVALDAAADVLVITPVIPIEIIRFGFMVTIAGTDATFVMALDRRVTAGSDTGRVLVDTLTAGAAVAQGKGMWLQLASPQKVIPGEQAVLEVTAGFTAGDGVVFALVKPLPMQPTMALEAVGVGDMINYTRKT